MANILDYLDWRGDLQISERGFNEVDNLILAEICYLDFSGFAEVVISQSCGSRPRSVSRTQPPTAKPS